MTSTTYGEAFTDAIIRHHGHRPHAPKLLARLADATPRAARNWLGGRCAPQLDQIFPMLARCDALLAEFNALVEAARENQCPPSSLPSAGVDLALAEDCSRKSGSALAGSGGVAEPSLIGSPTSRASFTACSAGWNEKASES